MQYYYYLFYKLFKILYYFCKIFELNLFEKLNFI